MIAPVRLQLSRAKGFNLQAHSYAVNGLAAVNCARPGKWGNPFRTKWTGTALDCANAYRKALMVGTVLTELRGKNLACWCNLGEPCHADVLLELANQETNP